MRKFVLKPGHPEKLHIQLLHHKQKYNWDCGISCVLMVLPKKHRHHLLKNFTKVCKEEGVFGSTWTIDLCYLLKRYEVGHVFYTVTLGVHPGYRGNSFYHNILTKDEFRVNQRFETAKASGVLVERASISMQTILDHLINGPVIVLTNARLLNCDVCKLNKISSELRKCIPWPMAYQGHYIVLCGYELAARKIHYRNPSFGDRVCVMSVEVLEEARKSYGTDEDVILVYK
ncbi:protein GUCD1 isoform X1 [Tribolium castaneum]|uniref:Protein GUCD1-like Protein n=1 Tax=Tribolium castaneum TaxID=7070 RepID=D2A5H0_TRICA|nr:PREDICTED: protein GUCD1 isoform X1 [Tribolium castaneum]EFA05371.2 Protein GUCD1-like Protein [Tribolium castaneum]|eukprot:XP_008201610.1 PREDICTED: protein GUCD1 isoform X1 [Tribolium castaneum]